MTSVANSSSRNQNGGASALDDVDAGWEDPPESASMPVTPASRMTSTPAPSLVPVVSVPRPRSSVRALAGPRSAADVVIEVSEVASDALSEDERRALAEGPIDALSEDERRALAEAETGMLPALESSTNVRDDELIEAGPSGAGLGVAPSATELELPDFRRRQPGRATFAALLASAAVIVAGIAWSQRVSSGEPVFAGVEAPVSERRAPERTTEPERTQPVPPVAPAPATSEVPSAPAPAVTAAVGASPQADATAVAVMIKVVPAGAVVFRAGRRLGTGLVEVSVERNVKQRFTALHDGYAPSNFTLDGSREAVTIVLRRAPRPRAEPAAPSDALAAEPSEASSATNAPAPTPEPAPESAPPAAPEPAAAPSEPSSAE